MAALLAVPPAATPEPEAKSPERTKSRRSLAPPAAAPEPAPAPAPAPEPAFDGAAATRKAKRLKVAELRAALEAAGASTEGTKPVLVERLVATQRAVSLL